MSDQDTGPYRPGVRRLGEMLLAQGLIVERDLEQALKMQAEVGGLLGQALFRLGAVTEETLLDVLSEQLGLPVLDISEIPREGEAIDSAINALSIAPQWFVAQGAAPWVDAADPTRLLVAAVHPLSPVLREAIDLGLDQSPELDAVQYFLTPSGLLETLLDTIRRHSGMLAQSDDDELADDAQRLRELAEEAPVIEFVNGVFSGALKERASDIHFEPSEDRFAVRYRIDGVLQARQSQPRRRFEAVASRIKLMSGMDIAERRLPQDGRQSIRFAGREIDLRVSTAPGVWGESIVVRLLEKEAELPDLEGLGLIGAPQRDFETMISAPNGIILVTGPTGSGKSTTLYRGLERINDGKKKIITIEDPVEYEVEGITQMQTKADIGFDFARGLRSILRQDPDVILVGEIRDAETASIASQAALTGHLVFSTLHTNTALAAVARLLDLGLEPFVIASSLRGVVAQRLVRKLCSECAVPASPDEVKWLQEEFLPQTAPGLTLPTSPRWRSPTGCDACKGEGYMGRLALYEVVPVDEVMRALILQGAPEADLTRQARQAGCRSLVENGLARAAEGVTSWREVLKAAGAETSRRTPEPASA